MQIQTDPSYNERLMRLVSEARTVSFDIFDTLLARPYWRPIDLFTHIEKGLGAVGFAAARINGEIAARAMRASTPDHSEVTLADIYSHIPLAFHHLKQVEIERELACVVPDPAMLDLFNAIKAKNTPIYLLSDMYLPGEVVRAMLEKCRYEGFQELLLSSEAQVQKATGVLFALLIEKSGVEAAGILHIGDNYHSDYLMPRQKGMNAYHYVPMMHANGESRFVHIFKNLQEVGPEEVFSASIIQGLIATEASLTEDASYWYKFGFLYGGPIAVAFASWLEEKREEHSLNKLAFLARDGYLFDKVYGTMFPGRDKVFMHASRRLHIIAGLTSVNDEFLARVADPLIIAGHQAPWTYSDFMDQFGFLSEDFSANFKKKFPRSDQQILTAEQLEELRSFLRDSEAIILKAGEGERKALMAYWKELGVTSGSTGFVDLGWKGTLYNNIIDILSLEGVTAENKGLYFATHHLNRRADSIMSFALDQGRPTDDILNKHQAVVLLELIFSAPNPSVIALEQVDGITVPKFQRAGPAETRRQSIHADIEAGVMRFAEAYVEQTRLLPISLSPKAATAPLAAVCLVPTPLDRAQLGQIEYIGGMGDVQRAEPVLATREKRHFAVVTPWPGTRCAEYEVVARLLKAARNMGVGMSMISRDGFLLSDNQEQTGFLFQPDEVDFVISVHYHLPKVLDAYHYLTLWNPPEIPAGVDDYGRTAENFITYDDFLSAGSKRIRSHLDALLINNPRELGVLPVLSTSFPKDGVLAPRLDNPALFYCGMNWEKVVYGTGAARHEGLFRLLDKTGKAKFYGPDVVVEWGGIRPWEGFSSYEGPIPFDGFSILEEINKCGIVLVISSDNHRRSGMATTRLFEACAGGALIISDDNAFVRENFSDSVLFIDYDVNDAEYTFKQIMAAYDWAISNKTDALLLATKSQQTFSEKFSFEKQITEIFDAHEQRLSLHRKSLFAINADDVVRVAAIVRSTVFDASSKAAVLRMLQNVERQEGVTAELYIAVDSRIGEQVRMFCESQASSISFVVLATELFGGRGQQNLSDFEVLTQLLDGGGYEYVALHGEGETWFTDHLTTLQRVLEEQPSAGFVRCGSVWKRGQGSKETRAFAPVALDNVVALEPMKTGEILFRAGLVRSFPETIRPFVDGLEVQALILYSLLKLDQKGAFSKRPTLMVNDAAPGPRLHSIKPEIQARILTDLFHYDYAALKFSQPQVPVGLAVQTEDTMNELIETRKALDDWHREAVKLAQLLEASEQREAALQEQLARRPLSGSEGLIEEAWSAADLGHATGYSTAAGWAADVGQPEGALTFGPYVTTVPVGDRVAVWRVLVDVNTGDDTFPVVAFDVYDATAGEFLSQHARPRQDWKRAGCFEIFELPFAISSNRVGHEIEFRTHFTSRAYVEVSWVGYR